jgi:hypothetical protein
MYNVGTHTLAPWKVLWPEVGHTVRAGVCGPKLPETNKAVLPDHTIIAVACESAAEAYFICALLNSAPAQAAAIGYIVLHPSPHILEHIAIPRFSQDGKAQLRLAELAERCHAATADGDAEALSALELKIDTAAAKLWGITDKELEAIREALAESCKSKGDIKEDEED